MHRSARHRRLKAPTFVLAVLILGIGSTVSAMPPYPGDQSQSGNVAKTAIDQRYTEIQSEWLEKGIDQPADIDFQSWLASTASTSKNILCILVKFPDKSNITDAAFFDTLVYENQVGSVRHYYNEVSYGQLDIVTVQLPSALGWVTAQNNYTYYTNGNYGTGTYPQNCQKLVEEAVDLVAAQVNFANYDNDSDGFVDGLMVVHSGRGAELTHSVNDIWSHKWEISPRLRDGKWITTYSIMPEYWYSAGDMTLGVFCHELGHVFGLPDLYDRDYSSNGVGKWSIMSTGSWNGYLGDSPAHFDAWSRIQLGFATCTNIALTTYGIQIPDVESSGTIYRLWSNGSIGNEYFLVENRRKTGYDAALPAEGLLVWHIDDNVSHNDDEWYPGHTSSGHYSVALVQADDNWSLEKGQSHGDTGDPFPGSSSNYAFTPLSLPNSNDYTEMSTLVGISNISAAADTMTADFFVSFISAADNADSDVPLPDAFTIEQNYPNPFNSETRIEYFLDSAGEIRIEIFNLLGQTILDVTENKTSSGSHSFTWDGKDSRGNNDTPAGVYFYRLTSGSQSQVKKMLFLK